jgi:hypothetical protein
MILTKLYSPGERCSQRRWWSLTSNVTPTYLFFLHSLCVPDQIGLSLSRERTVSGRNLSRREKWTKSEQTNILLRLFAVVNCWVVRSGIPGNPDNPLPVWLTWPELLLTILSTCPSNTQSQRNWEWPQLRRNQRGSNRKSAVFTFIGCWRERLEGCSLLLSARTSVLIARSMSRNADVSTSCKVVTRDTSGALDLLLSRVL